MGLLRKILKVGKKAAKNDLVQSAALEYAKKQSADVRRAAAVAEPILHAYESVKASGSDDPLKDTIYAVAAQQIVTPAIPRTTGERMPTQLEVTAAPVVPPATVQPVKPAFSTSTFKVATIAAILTPLIPILYKAAENWVGTLPPDSWLAMVMPGVLAAIYGALRYLTTNGERQASAQLAQAQANAIAAQSQAKAPENNAGSSGTLSGGNVTVGSTPSVGIPSANVSEGGLSDDAARELQAQAIIEQEAQNGSD
jgi:hypothetical protein